MTTVDESPVEGHPVVSHEQWFAARLALLEKAASIGRAMQHSPSRRASRFLLALTLAASAAVCYGGQVVAGQRAAAGAVPRTADGKPDLQGIWNNSTQTPLQRPAALGMKQFYTDEELARLRLRNHDAAPPDGDPGTYNQFWWEEGGLLKQTSLIVDPPDGRMPPLTPEGERRRKARAVARRRPRRQPRRAQPCRALHHAQRAQAARRLQQQLPDRADAAVRRDRAGDDSRRADHPARRPSARALAGAQLPRRLARPLGRRHAGRRDDELPSNIDETSYNCCGFAGEHLTIVERFTLVDEDTIDYRYTVNDPTTFTRPWTVSLPMRPLAGPIYEYACHEGNRAMEGVLRGGRASEDRLEKRSWHPDAPGP